MEPHGSTVTMPTPINSFEHKRSHDQVVDETSNIQLHPPKRLCSSPRKSGCVLVIMCSNFIIHYRTPRKHHTATPPIRSCDPIPMNPLEPGPSNQDDMLLLGNNSNSNAVDLDLLQSVITDSQLPQQLADSINAALQRSVIITQTTQTSSVFAEVPASMVPDVNVLPIVLTSTVV